MTRASPGGALSFPVLLHGPMIQYGTGVGTTMAGGRLFVPRGPGYLRPLGRAARANPARARRAVDWDAVEVSYTARFFVGFNVAGAAPMDVYTVMAIVEDAQRQNARNASSSYVTQQGIWQSEGDKAVFEDSAQVYLIAPAGADPRAWGEGVLDLAEVLAAVAHQSEVIVELFRNGMTVATRRVTRGDYAGPKKSLAYYRRAGDALRKELEAGRRRARAAAAPPRRARRAK